MGREILFIIKNMKKANLLKIVLIVMITVIAAGAFTYAAYNLDLFGVPAEERRIKAAIEEANYCETDADCIQLAGQCPFGCYIYVNKKEAGRVKAMVEAYQSNCVYGCIEAPDYRCVGGQCLPDLSRSGQGGDDEAGGGPSGFDRCAAAGNPVMESYPRQCRMDGVTYTEQIYQTGDLLSQECNSSADCGFTPFEFAVMSNCPYGTACLDGSCGVVCPMVEHDPNPQVSQSYAVNCAADTDCNCSDWDRDGIFPCSCVDGKCASVVASKGIFTNIFAEKYDYNPGLVEISLDEMSASHARGSVKFYMDADRSAGEGGIFLAVRNAGGWQIVFDGNGMYDCEEMGEYGFPDSMLPDCASKSTAGGANSQMANPASLYCQAMAGELEIQTDEAGGQYGVCILPDGKVCEEWEFFRGECGR